MQSNTAVQLCWSSSDLSQVWEEACGGRAAVIGYTSLKGSPDVNITQTTKPISLFHALSLSSSSIHKKDNNVILQIYSDCSPPFPPSFSHLSFSLHLCPLDG